MTAGTDARARLLELDSRRSSGWWGALLGVLGVGAVLAYLLYAYFYLFVSTDEWPPVGVPAPGLLRPVGVALLLITSLAPLRVMNVAARGHHVSGLVRGLGAVLALGAASLGAGIVVVATTGLQLERSAYEAIVLTVHVFHGVATAVGLVMVGATLRQAVRHGASGWVWSAGTVVSVWWSYVVVGWLVIGAVVYLWPQVS